MKNSTKKAVDGDDSIAHDESTGDGDDDEVDDLNMSDTSKSQFEKLIQTISSKFEATPEQEEKLKDKFIEVADLPENHQLSRGISKIDVPSNTLNQEPFSDEEVGIIERNWQSFCRDYDFDPDKDLNIFLPIPFCVKRAVLTRCQRRGFVQYISTGMPDRHPGSVYKKFCNIYGFYRKGSWTDEEDELLLSLYDLMPHQNIFAICSRILRRRRYLCYKRLKLIIKSGRCLYKTNLKRAIKGVGNQYPDWALDEEVWDRIANESSCEKKTLKKAYFLQIHPKLKVKESIPPLTLKRKLLSRLIAMEVTEWDEVDWKIVGRDVFSIGPVKAYSILRKMALKHVPKENHHRLDVTLKTLDEHYHASVRKSLRRILDKTGAEEC